MCSGGLMPVPRDNKQNNEFVQEYLYIEDYSYYPEDSLPESASEQQPSEQRGVIIIDLFS